MYNFILVKKTFEQHLTLPLMTVMNFVCVWGGGSFLIGFGNGESFLVGISILGAHNFLFPHDFSSLLGFATNGSILVRLAFSFLFSQNLQLPFT